MNNFKLFSSVFLKTKWVDTSNFLLSGSDGTYAQCVVDLFLWCCTRALPLFVVWFYVPLGGPYLKHKIGWRKLIVCTCFEINVLSPLRQSGLCHDCQSSTWFSVAWSSSHFSGLGTRGNVNLVAVHYVWHLHTHMGPDEQAKLIGFYKRTISLPLDKRSSPNKDNMNWCSWTRLHNFTSQRRQTATLLFSVLIQTWVTDIFLIIYLPGKQNWING